MLGGVFPHVRIQSNKLKVGEGSYFNENCKVYNQHGTVELGNDVAVAFGVVFVTTTHDHSDPTRRAGKVSGGDIKVGDGAGYARMPWCCPAAKSVRKPWSMLAQSRL